MPMFTCWLLVTCGPSWNSAPPPVIANSVCPAPNVSSSVRSRSSVVVLSLMFSPSPTVSAPLMVATASRPTRRGRWRRRSVSTVVNVPVWARDRDEVLRAVAGALERDARRRRWPQLMQLGGARRSRR